jgi:transcriptional regulator with XRE-family HTH domain
MPATAKREPHLEELGAFLRTRREQLTPADLGMEGTVRRRRVKGLRRDEVAERALISTDYYARIEQGRLAPSEPVLGSLIEVLRLDADQAEYLMSLAEHASRPVRPAVAAVPAPPESPREQVRPQVRRLLEQLADTPAIVMGPRTDILAWNSLAAEVYVDFDALPARERNYVRLIFTDPRMHERFDDWASVARSCVAILRREAVANPSDPALASLVGELSIADDRFGRWWAARDVARQDFGTKVLHHPEVGALTLDWEIFRYAGAPEQQLVLNFSEEGSVTQERLAQLAGRRPVSVSLS